MTAATSGTSANRPGSGDKVARRHSRIVWLIVLCVAAVASWSYVAVLDEVATAEGQVIPLRQEQSVDTLEGGILRDLCVFADQIVMAGQILA